MREKKLSRLTKTGSAALVSSVIGMMTVGAAFANDKLVELQKDEANWVMQGKNYSADHYSTSKQINKKNVSKLSPSWTFSTGVLNGHEGAPLVIGDMMYIHSPFPNNTFAINLNDPGTIVWEHKPKQDPAARAVACCDVVNRGLAYWPGDGKKSAGWSCCGIKC
jgi:methanol dehydrogenase (cytochrome c) subunit 1